MNVTDDIHIWNTRDPSCLYTDTIVWINVMLLLRYGMKLELETLVVSQYAITQ